MLLEIIPEIMKMVRFMKNDEEQQKNVVTMNGFPNGEARRARYRLDTNARTEIRRFQSPNHGESQNVNIPDAAAIQLGRRIRGERA